MAKTTTFTASLLMLLISLTILTAKAATIDLIHRDSVRSPYYNPSLESTNEPDIVVNNNAGGDYLVKFSMGTPPVPALATFSTRDDLTWIQCSKCASCPVPFFDFTKSSTYKNTTCKEPSCQLFPEAHCGGEPGDDKCRFENKFGDKFFPGEIATDTISLAGTSPGFSFGCEFDGDATGSGRSGTLGFARGKGSVVNQLKSIVQGKFSYCLVPLSSSSANSSKLHLGSNALVSGPGVVSTPLNLRSPDPLYSITLQGISVGNQRVDYQKGMSMIVETGTRNTLLLPDFYKRFLTAVKASIKLPPLADPKEGYDLCYSTKEEIQADPGFTAHFEGADVKLSAGNMFTRVSDDVLCLAVQSAAAQAPSVYGSLAQTNFHVGIDLQKNVVSFKAVDCSKGQ